ncbi:hypothetical protein FUAX_49920 (plasmid) [Fulvitalea axinellae]|uniref:Sulfatase-modifying factor enzyme-like domain-containing protein n=1 Tax=Fulvitalea axinellae TaxID=1182444 RepID=A0AAU9CTM4_9BACT|nr:hypothetical protein FUAX_49920 [Fulvitalea axinellae]
MKLYTKHILATSRNKFGKTMALALMLLTVTLASAQDIDDEEMVIVPAGEFIMGCDYEGNEQNCLEEASPAHKVYVDGFRIDKYMVTYRRYNKCVAEGVCTPLFEGAACNAGMPWNSNHPVNCVDYAQAAAFCEWDGGKRLPTEAEWEKAARGTDGRKFPWGNQSPNCDLAVMNRKKKGDKGMGPGCGAGTTQPVGSRPKGASPYGAMDMAGNLFEWTADWFDPAYFKNSPKKNPKGPKTGHHKTLKGSSWLMRTDAGMMSSVRSGYSPLGQGYVVGFRCAKTL